LQEIQRFLPLSLDMFHEEVRVAPKLLNGCISLSILCAVRVFQKYAFSLILLDDFLHVESLFDSGLGHELCLCVLVQAVNLDLIVSPR
jgi:hypothetical protein